MVRNLSVSHAARELPTGEKQMLAKAKRILASELMYARDLSEDEAVAFLEDVLGDVRADERTCGEDAPQPAAASLCR